MRGILAAAGAATVAALSATTPQPPALAANVLTVTGYTFGGTIEWDMAEIFQGAYCSEASGNTCSAVRYLSGLPVGGEADGLRALRAAINTTASPTTVVGFSQGATISTHWIRENAGDDDAPSPDELSFVLAANPLRKYGGIRSRLGIDQPTPGSEYNVLDIAIQYDGAADFPDNPLNILAVANAIAGFQYVHIFGYQDIDLDSSEKLVWTEGNTTYVLLRRENLPLLEPLRMLGLDELADRLNGPLKEIIDSAYDRDYPGLVDPADHDEVLQDALSGTTGKHALGGPRASRFSLVADQQVDGVSGVGRHSAPDATVDTGSAVDGESDSTPVTSDGDEAAEDTDVADTDDTGTDDTDDTAADDTGTDDTAADDADIDDTDTDDAGTDTDTDTGNTSASSSDSDSSSGDSQT